MKCARTLYSRASAIPFSGGTCNGPSESAARRNRVHRRWRSHYRTAETRRVTPRAALAFVRRHGVVLESAKGPVPNLAEAAVGAPIRGNWWGHPKGKQIFWLTRAVRD